MSDINNPKLEKIIWDDAGAFGEQDESWQTVDQIINDYQHAQFEVVSVGFVIHEDDSSIIVVQNHDKEYKQYSNPLRIPKTIITKRIFLEACE